MNVYQLTALAIAIVFYGAYIAKNLTLRKVGIKSNRLAQGTKPKKTHRVELVLSLATLIIAMVQVVSIFGIIPSFAFINGIAITGLIISAMGVTIFIIAMWTMRQNWRAGIDSEQKTELVFRGIYKYSRNPAFLGFDLFYIGLMFALPNILLIIITLLCVILFHMQIIEEEKFLDERFKEQYQIYSARTKRYLGIR